MRAAGRTLFHERATHRPPTSELPLRSILDGRIATGAQAGRKVVTLQTLPGDAGPLGSDAGKVGGFSLHAGVAADAHESQKLERLCRYIARPAISEKRLSLSPQGTVHYQLTTPWENGTTHVEFEPIEFVASNSRPWCRRVRTSPASTAYLRQTRRCARN